MSSAKENFTVNTREVSGINCLDISGYLDAHTAPKLENVISATIEAGNKNILVNFNELEYISSAGLGVFMAFIEDVRNDGGDIKMSNMNDKVFSVFDLLGFPMLFDIEKHEQEAVDKFLTNNLRSNVDE